jgi:hypothetical protein
VSFDVIVVDHVGCHMQFHVGLVDLDRLLGALLVFDRHVVLLDRIRRSTGPPNGLKSSVTIMTWRFLELKTPPPPRRPRVHLLRPVPAPKELVRTAPRPFRHAA